MRPPEGILTCQTDYCPGCVWPTVCLGEAYAACPPHLPAKKKAWWGSQPFSFCYLTAPWKKSHDEPRQSKQRHHFASKGPSSQSYGFSSSHVWMWELDHKEGWALKNCCFWTVVLKKILESPLNRKEIQPFHPKGNQPLIFTGRTDAEVEMPTLCPSDEKIWLTGKDSDAGKDGRQKEKGEAEDEMVR